MQTDPANVSELLADSQVSLYAFIKVLMHGLPEAADVLQETNLRLLRNEDKYDPERPFMPWARGVARKCVLKFYSARKQRELVVFDDALVESLATQVPCESGAYLPDELDQLRDCLNKLPPRQRAAVEARYMCGESIKTIAAREKRTTSAVAVMLHRIRQILAECMERGSKQPIT
jgi:RNA polymerase sigma-70 factor (ECF subfamily)